MSFCLDVKGDYACFTRPEMKVERVSYDVITPSSARSIFESILWKPAIFWQITKIEILSPICWMNIRRNEVSSVISAKNVQVAMKTGRGCLGLIVEECRQQRAGLILKDVHYRIHGKFLMTEKAGPRDNPGKFAEMFTHRAKKGQCINQPFLGCREFACSFELCDEYSSVTEPINEDRDLGYMLYDMDFSDPKNPKPMFFRAKMQKGIINVPERNSAEVIA